MLTGLEGILNSPKKGLNCCLSLGARASLMDLTLAIVGKIPSIVMQCPSIQDTFLSLTACVPNLIWTSSQTLHMVLRTLFLRSYENVIKVGSRVLHPFKYRLSALLWKIAGGHGGACCIWNSPLCVFKVTYCLHLFSSGNCKYIFARSNCIFSHLGLLQRGLQCGAKDNPLS